MQEIDDWIADSEADQVYWLRERAGFGKTAVAVSVAERAAVRGELAASFFFSHQVSDLSNASLFFSTIASQLALFDQRRYRQYFAEAVRERPDAGAAKLKIQADLLFTKPLQRAESTSRPIVIVIDGLDECNREQGKELVDVLIKATRAVSVPIRLFITSRPEHHLITAFRAVEVPARTIVDTSRDDVETFLRKELAEIPQKLGLLDLPTDWISEEDIAILLDRANGLFVYGSTAIRFIGDPVALNPRKRLKILLVDDDAQSSAYQPYGPLDRLYQRILDLATSKQQDLIEEVHVVLGAWIVLNDQAMTSVKFMARILAIEISDIRRTLVKLQSVIVNPETDNDKIIFHHTSFKDFLLDSSRSSPIYFIDTSIHHRRLAICSFQILTQSPFGTEVEIAMASDKYFPKDDLLDDAPEELRYVSTGAFYHAAKASKDESLKDAFDAFWPHGALWWLEDVYLMCHAQDILHIYAWRVRSVHETLGVWNSRRLGQIAEGNSPDRLIVLKAFGSLLPSSVSHIASAYNGLGH